MINYWTMLILWLGPVSIKKSACFEWAQKKYKKAPRLVRMEDIMAISSIEIGGISLSAVKENRSDKGKYKISIEENDYTVIDIETTGLDPNYDEIIELGAIQYQDNKEVCRFQSLVKPTEEIPEFIEELTGVTNEMVAEAPTLESILPQFLGFVGKNLLLGHNINFDINFIYDCALNLELPPFSNDYMDTMFMSRRLFKGEKTHKLSAVCLNLNIPQPEEHRALADCIRTHLCYQAMKQYCINEGVSFSILQNGWKAQAKNITAQTDVFNEDGPVYQKVFVFTGTLDKMTRKEAMQAVVDCGGIISDNVTKKTNYLVLGNNDYCKSIREGKSNKQKKAEKLQLEGLDIETISEDVFYDMLQDSFGPEV